MNRHRRRTTWSNTWAQGRDGPPAAYIETCQRMGLLLQRWLRDHPDDPPKFALPGRAVLVIGCILDCDVARNAAARQLVDAFCAAGRAIQKDGEPTLNMLRAVLDLARVPYEVVPVDAFGRYVVLSPGSGSSN